MVSGQINTKEKSNEIVAMSELLHVLELEGCIVTIDAMGRQKEIITTNWTVSDVGLAARQGFCGRTFRRWR